MIKAILIIAFALLAISGICELIHALCIFLVAPKRPTYNYCVINLNEENAYYQLRFALEQLRWNGDNFAERIIAITDDISLAQQNRCKAIADNNDIILCTSNMLPNIIKSLSSFEV